MPELPEVETTRRGLAPHVVGRSIAAVEVREPRLRWPVAKSLAGKLAGQRIDALERRGKYLLFGTQAGTLLVHLGMSGSLKFLRDPPAHGPHDHVDLVLAGGGCLRFNDPRRFGSWLLTSRPDSHPLLKPLGPEPLSADFTADYLASACRGRRVAIKPHLMNGRIVVGVGNIYANEALFRGHSPAARRGSHRAREIRAARRVDPRGARGRARGRWHDAAQLRRRRRQPGLFPPVAPRLRAHGRAVPALRFSAPRARRRAARDLLLRALPALVANRRARRPRGAGRHRRTAAARRRGRSRSRAGRCSAFAARSRGRARRAQPRRPRRRCPAQAEPVLPPRGSAAPRWPAARRAASRARRRSSARRSR